MAWFGKIIGGTVGLLIGGPIGAVGGIALGHCFIDESDENLPTGAHGVSRMSVNEQRQAIFFITTFSLLAKLAKADGVISKSEIDVIDKLMKRDMRMNQQERSYAIQVFDAAKDSRDSFEDYAMQFYQLFSSHRQLLQSMTDVLLRVAAADGDYHPEEERMILSAMRIFNLSDAEYLAAKSRYIADTEKHYTILRSKPKDPDDVIKKNYRKLANEFHPDKIESKGLPPEFGEFAHKKFQEIQNAYASIKKERKMK
jgi:DnaJ like chaperone protein